MEELELKLGKGFLLRSLEELGVPLPHGVSSIQTLIQTPDAFFSICARSLRRIDRGLLLEEGEDLATISLAKKFSMCTDLSTSIEKLGYTGGQIRFHQLLYPCEEDVNNLLRFLVERVSDTCLKGGEICTRVSRREDGEESSKMTSEIGDMGFDGQHPDMKNLQEWSKSLEEVEMQLKAIILERKSAAAGASSSRKCYIQRISELTKSSRKQDADIEGILKDTRELQIESNSIQDRLHRTYALAEETMLRDVKKKDDDAVRHRAYTLLTTIHDTFGHISQKILVTDRIQRQVAHHEAKLASLSTPNFNMINQLQVDLDAMRRENHMLEKHL